MKFCSVLFDSIAFNVVFSVFYCGGRHLLGMISLPLTYFMQKTLQIKEKEDKIRDLVSKMVPNAEILAKSVKLFDSTYQIRLTIVYSDMKTAYKIRKLKNKIKDLFVKENAILKITLLKSIEAEKIVEREESEK